VKNTSMLLFDENLATRLAMPLADIFPGSVHFRDMSLQAALDATILNFAGDHGFYHRFKRR